MTAAFQSRNTPGTYRIFGAALVSWPITIYMLHHPGSALITCIVTSTLGVIGVLVALARHITSPRSQLFARKAVALSAVTLSCVVVISAQVAVHERQRSNTELIAHAQYQREITVNVTVDGFVKHTHDGFSTHARFIGKAIGTHHSTPIMIWLKKENANTPISHGMQLSVTGKITQNSPTEYAAFSLNAGEVQVVSEQPLVATFGRFAQHMRQVLNQNARQVFGAELVPGFATGETSLVSKSLKQAMLESSLSHLTAVSGSNTALVIAAVITVLSLLQVPQKPRIIVAAIALCAFVFLVGPDASVQRAAVMSVALLASNFGSKRRTAIAALGCAMVFLIAMNPWQTLQPGFALSVLATAGILLGTQPIQQILHKHIYLPKLFAMPIAVAITAQLSVGPVLLLLQPGVPLSGIVANIIAAPAAPLGTLFGMIAALLGPFNAFAAHVAVVFASFASRWVSATAYVVAGVQYGRLNWPDGWQGALTLLLCELGIAFAWAIRRGIITLMWLGRVKPRLPWQSRQPVPWRIALVSSLFFAASFAAITIVTFVTPVTRFATTPANWAVVACDVGQGDAVLLRNPAYPDDVMLVDTGDNSDALRQCIDQFGVKNIRLLVLTHDDKDHVGALESILDITESAVISSVAISDLQSSRVITRQLEDSNVPHRIVHAGHSGTIAERHLTWRVLAPQHDAVSLETNDTSLVLRVDIAEHSVVLLADTGEEAQDLLVNSQAVKNIDIVKVSHHGSRDHSQHLTNVMSATWGLISAGRNNSYGHPTKEALASLESSGTQVLRTDVHSTVALLINTNGELEPWVQETTAV